jgi:hypothetical protein
MTTEIEAERAQLLALAADAPQASERSESERRADVAANLSAGLALFRVGAASADDERDLKTIAEGCF